MVDFVTSRLRKAFAIAFVSIALAASVAIATKHQAIGDFLDLQPHSCGGG